MEEKLAASIQYLLYNTEIIDGLHLHLLHSHLINKPNVLFDFQPTYAKLQEDWS